MSYVVIDTDGALHVRDATPNADRINTEVGEPGWDNFPIRHPNGGLELYGWVNDCGFVGAGLSRNVVGSCVVITLGAAQQPYAGPIVITGWDQDREIIPLQPGARQVVSDAHRAVRVALGLDSGDPGQPAGWCEAVRQLAAFVRESAAPKIELIGPGHPRWPFGGAT